MRFRKINRVNAIIAKFLIILKSQSNRATLRSDPTQGCGIIRWKKAAGMSLFFYADSLAFSPNIPSG
ncbi:MAG: hypothetical protein ACI4I6_00325 [Hominimerdicola sp.]